MNKIYFYDDDIRESVRIDTEPLKDGFIFSNDFEIHYYWNGGEFCVYYNNGFFVNETPYAFTIEASERGIVFDEENRMIDIEPSAMTGLTRFGNLTLLNNDNYDYQTALQDVKRHFYSEDGFEYYTHVFMGISAALYAMSEIMRKGKERRRLIKKGECRKHKYSREHRLSVEKNKVWLLDDIVQYVSDNYIENKGTHKINCPCWEVRGHYRHYKSGKVVFIPSYRKGKRKDTAQPKEKEYYI